jgi:hypothetical protein
MGMVTATIFALVGLPLAGLAANLLQNDGLEPPFEKYGIWDTGLGKVFDLEVAHGWERYYIPAGTVDGDEKLRYFRSSALEFLYGFIEKRDGTDAQLFWSKAPFDAGIYQQISGLTIGESYGFQAGVLQIYGDTGVSSNNKMFRSVGIDPHGGTIPTSTNVIWGPEENRTPGWFYPGVGTTAMSSTVTVFVRVRSLEDAPAGKENSVWVDDTFLDVAPDTQLVLSLNSPTEALAQWSGNPRSGFKLFAYEAQFRKSADPTWTDLQIFTSNQEPSTNTSKTFPIELGVEYTVRARTWHEQVSGDSHEVPGPWLEQTFVTGRVLDNRGNGVDNALVIVNGISGTTNTTTTGGAYMLQSGTGTFGLEASAGPAWQTSQPVSVTLPVVTAVAPLTLTLRPINQAITNGDFETDLAGWQVTGTSPSTITEGIRSGSGSLRLTDTVTISQMTVLSGVFKPTLSFWYKLAGEDGNGLFTAELLGDNQINATNLQVAGVFSSTIGGEWAFVWLPLESSEIYTGAASVRFSLSQPVNSQTRVYLDEVSLGAAWGGPNKRFLPLIFKN